MEYYTPRQAAKLLGVTYHAFMARLRRGKYSHIKLGWAVFVPKEEIDPHAETLEETERAVFLPFDQESQR